MQITNLSVHTKRGTDPRSGVVEFADGKDYTWWIEQNGEITLTAYFPGRGYRVTTAPAKRAEAIRTHLTN